MAVKLTAWQQVFARVEREQSPTGRVGLQTVYYSRAGLTEEEVGEVEARLNYAPAPAPLVKHLFFPISTGKVVVGEIRPLPGLDSAGRLGLYLAHCLLFAPDDFARLGADPFVVLDTFPFFRTWEAAAGAGDRATGDLPPAALELPPAPPPPESVAPWSPPAVAELALLALGADRLARDRRTVALIGEPPAVLEALRLAFLAVPPALRLRCSFDTYFEGGNLVGTFFWATGFLSRLPSVTAFAVDTRTRSVTRSLPRTQTTPYEQWVTKLLAKNDLPSLVRNREAAWALCQLLQGEAPDRELAAGAGRAVVEGVFGDHPELVRSRLRETFLQRLPRVLADRAASRLGQGGAVEQRDLLLSRDHRRALLDLLYADYEQAGFAPPPRPEWEALDEVLEPNRGHALQPIHDCWGRRYEELRSRLSRLDEGAYRRAIATVLGAELAQPAELVLPGRSQALIDEILRRPEQAALDLPALASALLKAGEQAGLDALALMVDSRPEEQLRQLARLIEDNPKVPRRFRAAVEQATAHLPDLLPPVEEILRRPDLGSMDLLALVGRVLKEEKQALLDSLADRVAGLTKEQLRQLNDLVKEDGKVPQRFRAAVRQAAANLAERLPLVEKLLQRLTEEGVELAKLARVVLDLNQPIYLEALSRAVAGRPEGELRQLARLIEDKPDVPPKFRSAVERAARGLAQEAPPSVFRRALGRWWRK